MSGINLNNQMENQMNKTTKFLSLVGAVTLGLAVQAHAADTGKEKCYGVAAAGKNDCKGGGNMTCAGNAKTGQGFVLVPTGTCAKINGGATVDPTTKS